MMGWGALRAVVVAVPPRQQAAGRTIYLKVSACARAIKNGKVAKGRAARVLCNQHSCNARAARCRKGAFTNLGVVSE